MADDRWQQFVREVRDGAHPDYQEHWRLFQALTEGSPETGPPVPVWQPGRRELESSNLAALLRRLDLSDYRQLHRWSVTHRARFWAEVLTRLDLRLARQPDEILDLSQGVEHPCWLPGARLNIVDSCLGAPPDSTAIVFASEDQPQPRRVSRAELESRVDRIARGLVEHDFQEDQAIVLYMPMTVDCVAAYLGIIRAGCRVVSVADSFSATELGKRMQIADAAAVITVASYTWAGKTIELYPKVRNAIDAHPAPVRSIVIPGPDGAMPDLATGDLDWNDLLATEASYESVIGAPDRVTNVLFSSGTTGLPKAIPWTQLTPIKCAMDGHFHHDIQAGDVVAWPTNIGWMMGPWLIYASLLNRATMALFAGAPHSRAFVEFVTTARVHMLGLVPALVRAWRSKDLVDVDQWSEIKLFSSTGEVSNPEDYLWLMSRSGYRAPVIEYLGGTEIGGGHATGSVLLPSSPSTFSTPALGIDFVVLDEDGQPTGEGELGELYLIPPSIGLSQTLLNKDHHEIYYAGCPVGPRGEVLRRHGDEFIRLGGGYLKAQGRTDDTMNLGGIKVSSIELEEVINGHPEVFECAAIAVQPEGVGTEQLVVYVVPAGSTAAGLQESLGRLVATELNPLFKIHDVVYVESLPRTASNKVMRRELRREYLGS